jgi:hypothetical protein
MSDHAEDPSGGADGAARGTEPNDRPCSICGHVWFAGERRHVFQAAGGSEEGSGPVIVVCTLCALTTDHRPTDDLSRARPKPL